MESKVRNIKGKSRDFICSSRFPLFLYALFSIILSFVVSLHIGDDPWFKNVLANGVYFSEWKGFLVGRYNGWSSRIIIEALLILIVHLPFLWRILNAAAMIWIAQALSMFFNRDKDRLVAWFISIGMAMLPIGIFNSAGWIATTLNYVWPLSLGLFAMLPIRNRLYGIKTPRYLYPIAVLCLVYATNQEQMCAVIFAVFGLFSVYFWFKEKRVDLFTIMGTLLSVCGFVFILTCPGNTARSAAEIAAVFPQFSSFSLFSKLEMGFVHAVFEFSLCPNFFFLVFSFVLFSVVLLREKRLSLKLFPLIPLISSTVIIVFFVLFIKISKAYYLAVYQPEALMGNNTWWIFIVFSAVLGLTVLISLFLAFKDKIKAAFSLFIILLGLATAWVMGFSPTVWVSENRTRAFMYIAFISVGALLVGEINKYRKSAESEISDKV